MVLDRVGQAVEHKLGTLRCGKLHQEPGKIMTKSGTYVGVNCIRAWGEGLMKVAQACSDQGLVSLLYSTDNGRCSTIKLD